jgi:hypothetical protein
MHPVFIVDFDKYNDNIIFLTEEQVRLHAMFIKVDTSHIVRVKMPVEISYGYILSHNSGKWAVMTGVPETFINNIKKIKFTKQIINHFLERKPKCKKRKYPRTQSRLSVMSL